MEYEGKIDLLEYFTQCPSNKNTVLGYGGDDLVKSKGENL